MNKFSSGPKVILLIYLLWKIVRTMYCLWTSLVSHKLVEHKLLHIIKDKKSVVIDLTTCHWISNLQWGWDLLIWKLRYILESSKWKGSPLCSTRCSIQWEKTHQVNTATLLSALTFFPTPLICSCSSKSFINQLILVPYFHWIPIVFYGQLLCCCFQHFGKVCFIGNMICHGCKL